MIGDIYVKYPDRDSIISCFVAGTVGGPCHVEVEIGCLDGQGIALVLSASAQWRRVMIAPAPADLRMYDVKRLRDDWHGKAKFYQATEWALKEAFGLPYDFPQLAGIRWNLPWMNSNRRFICSELVREYYRHAGIELRPDVPDWRLDPEQLRSDEKLRMVAARGFVVS